MSQGKKLQVFKSDIVIKDFYNHYLITNLGSRLPSKIDKSNPLYIDQKTYSKVLQEFNQEIYNLLFQGFVYRIPQIGEISLRLKKVEAYIDKEGNFRNPLPIDRRATKLLWERDPQAKEEKRYVYHDNEHSDGYILKLYYDRYGGLQHNILKDYKVMTTRTMKLDIAKLMKSGDYLNKFYEIRKNKL